VSLRRDVAPVVASSEVGKGAFELTVRAPEIAREIRPGQFVMLGLTGGPPGDVFLDRPMSYFQRRGEALSVLFRVVGRGTKALSRLRVGDVLQVMGPLGRALPDLGRGRVVYVGGGVGVPPLFDAARAHLEAGGRARVLIGARTAAEVLGEAAFRSLGLDVSVATDDGTGGRRGLVTDLLRPEDDLIVACGPTPMLRSVQAFTRTTGGRAYLILEARMACGFGACLGCTVRTAGRADPYQSYARVCTEGPVFLSDEVVI